MKIDKKEREKVEYHLKQVAVIGAGEMGQQIAMLSALGGYKTYLQDINESALVRALERLQKQMVHWVEKGKLSHKEKDHAFSRLQITKNLDLAVQEADLVIEAVVEKLEIKRKVFKELDAIAPEHTVFATNSSTIVNSKLAEVTSRADRVLNMHFFFPPLVMDCIEVVKSERTSERSVQIALDFCKKIGLTAVLLEKEIFGFIANRILLAISKEALHLYEGGYADFKQIDFIVKKALGHSLGPFEIMDLSGLDVAYYANMEHYHETGDPQNKPAKSIVEKVEQGYLGRKTGKGWYEYERGEAK